MVEESRYNIDSLNIDNEKKEAIKSIYGPLLIIAGPGSGKTKTLVERTVNLIANHNIDAESILVATFTEKAAGELITRITQRLLELGIKVNLNEMYIGTLHSIFLRFLEEFKEYTGLKKNYKVLNQFDQHYLVYKHWREFSSIENFDTVISLNRQWNRISRIVSLVSKLGEEALTPEDLIAKENMNLSESQTKQIQVIRSIFSKYNEVIKNSNSLDFTTIQTTFLNLITDSPDVLERIRDKIKFIMIDEYQDTNTIQEKLIFQLLNPDQQNLCVVGDDDQGLYRFRGASIRNILEFPQKFSKGKCKIIKLETNYRSHPDIINFYNTWMNDQQSFHWENYRYQKTIKPQEKDFEKYQSVLKLSGSSDEEWYEEVVSFIETLKLNENFEDYNQISFLFKSVKHKRAVGLANYLESRGIRVFSPRSALFFEREEVRKIIGALIFIFSSYFDSIKTKNLWANDILVWFDGCAEYFGNSIREDREKHKDLLKWIQQKVSYFETFAQTSDHSFSSLFYELMKFPMFSEHLDVDLNQPVFDQRAALNLALFSKLLTKFEYYENISILSRTYLEKNLQKLILNFLRFLRDGGLEEYEDFDSSSPSGCVSFMTIHQSKGLEFPITIVGSLYGTPRSQFNDIDEMLSQHYYEKDPFEPLDETKYYDFWRLYYTAFSRAKNLLVLTASEKSGRGREPSRYFDFIYEGLRDWKEFDTELACIKYDKISNVDIKKQYSFTRDIILYENCPLQYKFFKELGFVPIRNAPTLFGLLVYQTIEDVHKAALKDEAHTIKTNLENWFDENYNGLTKLLGVHLAQGQLQVALRQVERYIDRNSNRWEHILECEVDVSHVEDDYILMGKIDLVMGEHGKVDILDFKTERDKPDVNTPEGRKVLQRYRRQLEVYAHILEQSNGVDINKMHIYYTGVEDSNPYITWDRLNINIDKTINEVELVIKNIEHKNYSMSDVRTTEKQCENCDMRFYCKKR